MGHNVLVGVVMVLYSDFRPILAFWMLDECKALVLREINCLLCYAGEGGLSNADGSFPRNTGFLYFTSLYHSKLKSYPQNISTRILTFIALNHTLLLLSESFFYAFFKSCDDIKK